MAMLSRMKFRVQSTDDVLTDMHDYSVLVYAHWLEFNHSLK